MIKEWGAQSPEWGPPNDQVIVKFCGTPLLCLLVKVFSFLETRTSNPEEPKISGTEGINFENVSLGVMVKRIDCASIPWFLKGHSTMGQPLIQHIYLILSPIWNFSWTFSRLFHHCIKPSASGWWDMWSCTHCFTTFIKTKPLNKSNVTGNAMPVSKAFCKPWVGDTGGGFTGRESKFFALLGLNSSKDELLPFPRWKRSNKVTLMLNGWLVSLRDDITSKTQYQSLLLASWAFRRR